MIAKPAVSKYKFTLDSATMGNTWQVSTSACELVSILVTGGSADITVGVYDTSTSAILQPKDAIYVGANQGESMSFVPSQPIPMNKGIYLYIEEGGGSFNGKVTIQYN